MNAATEIVPDSAGRMRRPVSIQRLLEWAFAEECASIDFEDPGTLSGALPSFGMEYVLLERQRLGCSVDGGGRSDPHPDADLVASAVAVLPENVGGRSMAVHIAELARARSVPDCMVDATPKCVPVGWSCNRHGWRSKTEVIGHYEALRNRKSVRQPIRISPVTYEPSAQKIGSARRAYLDWYRALLDLRSTFQIHNNLSAWTVVDTMPTQRPWDASRKKVLT